MRVMRDPLRSNWITCACGTTMSRFLEFIWSGPPTALCSASLWASRAARMRSCTPLNLLKGKKPGRGEADCTARGASKSFAFVSVPRFPTSFGSLPPGLAANPANSILSNSPCRSLFMKSFVSLVPICSAALSRYDSVGDPVGNTGVIRSRRTVAGHGGLEISESIRYGDQPPQNRDLPPRQKASPGNSRFQGFGLSEFQGTPQTSFVFNGGGRV